MGAKWVYAGMLGLTTWLIAPDATSCEPRVFVNDDYRRATLVAIGYVTGDHYTDYEQDVLTGEDPELMPLWGERLVRVVTIDVLRGQLAERIVEVKADCGWEIPKAMKRVIVIDVDGSRTLLGANWEGDIRKALSTPNDPIVR